MFSRLNSDSKGSLYRDLLRNRAYILLTSAQAISAIGGAFFNIAVMWGVYTQSGSTLMTALVQVVWHFSNILFGPLSGVWVDRGNRKRIMVMANILSAVVTGAAAGMISALGQTTPVAAFVTVFLLNGLAMFLNTARFSIVPEIVSQDSLATASGLSTTVRQAAALLGNALAGIFIAAASAAWALVINAFSFLLAALSIAVAPLPKRTSLPAPSEQHPSFFRELADGWRTVAGLPVVRALVWLGVFINVASFTGPIFPALISQQLGGDVADYGLLEAAGVIGGVVAGALAGGFERRLGAGRVLSMSWGIAGLCYVGMAASPWLSLTIVIEAVLAFSVTVGMISSGALMMALSPENYRGRIEGVMSALSVLSIPLSTLIGGWLTDILGPTPLFVVGGSWVLFIAALAAVNPHIRTARIGQEHKEALEYAEADPAV